MSLLGIHLTLLIGPTVAIPAPPFLLEALDRIEIKNSVQRESGFELRFHAGRSGPGDLNDFKLLNYPLLKTGNRVIIVVIVNSMPRVLMDGIITSQKLGSSNTPGATTFSVFGIDLTAVMGKEQRQMEFPALPESEIVRLLILKYALYGLLPLVLPPKQISISLDKVTPQSCSDLAFIRKLAKRNGYVFYIRPGPVPFTNLAYWGPPIMNFVPQKALSVNLGGETNIEKLDFQYDAEKAKAVSVKVKDPFFGIPLPVRTFTSFRLPPLAVIPALGFLNVRIDLLKDSSGLDFIEAFARAQAETNVSTDEVLTATGELDAARYGGPLEAWRLVGVRGAGYLYDGLYFVTEVTHVIKKGEYKQRFRLAREGLGSTTPVVPV